MEDGIVDHVVRPIKLSVVMVETRNDVCSRDWAGIMPKTFADPGEHERDVYASKEPELRTIYAALDSP